MNESDATGSFQSHYIWIFTVVAENDETYEIALRLGISEVEKAFKINYSLMKQDNVILLECIFC